MKRSFITVYSLSAPSVWGLHCSLSIFMFFRFFLSLPVKRRCCRVLSAFRLDDREENPSVCVQCFSGPPRLWSRLSCGLGVTPRRPAEPYRFCRRSQVATVSEIENILSGWLQMAWTDMKVVLNISNLAPSSKILGYLSYIEAFTCIKLIHTVVECLFKVLFTLCALIMYYSDINYITVYYRIWMCKDCVSLGVSRLSNSLVYFKVPEDQALTCTGHTGAHRCMRRSNKGFKGEDSFPVCAIDGRRDYGCCTSAALCSSP